jgi:molybdopterin converting factor small subunit
VLGLGQRIAVVVEVYGLAERFVAPGAYTLRDGATVGALLAKAARQRPRPPLALMIGGRRVADDTRLADGDVLKVLQMPAGG